ncbi:hypothetical protein PHLCEN_2v8270 [Hermanssonia centrifuga]|uniref:B30.2/SPRY domain-containing protein n=1 Tax=Hermanssonia centrifuga TaxID=98765 RepID=A0A2R6NU19_9APHY|nr:hypothetical protein PHLCEN_2v8270 [Hermanssonia centrifuga]
MSWLKALRNKGKTPSSAQGLPFDVPPDWTPAPERSHTLGLRNEASDDEYASAEAFCARHPLETPKLLSSDMVERIDAEGCRAWTMEWPGSPRFIGSVHSAGEKRIPEVTKVTTADGCGDVCLLSNLPLLAGLYEIQGKSGVYYEVRIQKMNGIVAIGTACRPYPDWRFPGWNRASVGLHLDDMRKFFEDPDGGRDYSPLLTSFSVGSVIGCGYDFTSSSVFYTYDGQRLPDAFGGVYLPRTQYDVYAAIGVEGACEFEVNFGSDLFKWKEGNEWAWRVEGHVGRLSGTSAAFEDELPTYEEARRR